MALKLKVKDKEYVTVPFKKGKHKCPVCGGKTGWNCDVTMDDGLAYCSAVPSGKTDKRGRYEHILRKDSSNISTIFTPISQAKPNEVVKADSDRLNKVYTALLSSLKLAEQHSDNLLNERGLSDTTIARSLYATVPSRNKNFEVGMALAKRFNLEGIPGFYIQDGCWALNINYSGFYVPYRDVQGRIVGLQIRKDIGEKPKYLWLSSSDKEKGCSSGSPLHFVNPDFVRANKTIFITEGALKADIINEKLEAGIVAMAGVTAVNHHNLVNSIFEVFPDLERVVIAFDMDWKENEAVKKALSSLLNVLKERYISVFVADWDISLGKGLDDLVNSEEFLNSNDEFIDYIPAQDFLTRFFSEEVDSSDQIQVQEIEESSDFDEKQIFVEDEKEPVIPDSQEDTKMKTTLGSTWRELSKAQIEKPERVIAGLCRGNLGQLVAATNIGKTTLILNLAISASSDKIFEPLFNEQTVGKRIMYIDGEATKGELQADLLQMLETCSLEEQEQVKDNLYLICDEEINDEPLDLVNFEHLEKIQQVAKLFKPDLIVIDTLSALANIEDENDNAKVKKEIIQPLKTLAKKTNSAVLMLHHSGKYTEGSPQAQDAYKGRGASALGALSRTVYNLKESKGGVTLSCSKVKGEKFPQAVLKLDQNLRWFKVIGDSAKTSSKPLSNYEQVIKFVRDAGKPVKRDEIKKGLGLKDATLTRLLEEAVKNGDLTKPEYGYYSVPENANLEQELPIEK